MDLEKAKAILKHSIAQTKVIGLLLKLLGEVLWAKSNWWSNKMVILALTL